MASETTDNILFQHLARVYSSNHAFMHKGRTECSNFPEGITNGAKWYVVKGGMQDFKWVTSKESLKTLRLNTNRLLSLYWLAGFMIIRYIYDFVIGYGVSNERYDIT